MDGLRLREQLESDLGYESDRARTLPLNAIADEISIFWEKSKLPEISAESFLGIARTSLTAGTAGWMKLSELLQKILDVSEDDLNFIEIATNITALATKHQSVLNLSRNRATYINAHLNILDPERTLKRIYSAYLSELSLKKYEQASIKLLKNEINSQRDLRDWISQVHSQLNSICNEATKLGNSDNEERIKGIISPKAMPTYFKQWEMFVIEMVGPSFGITLREIELSPLTDLLNKLENSKTRSWTKIEEDITEARKSETIQRKLNSTISRTSVSSTELISRKIPLSSGKTCEIKMSKNGINRNLIDEFIQGMRAQFAIYGGRGIFHTQTSINSGLIELTFNGAEKADLKDLEKYLLSFN
jgi:hypothetical protein